MKTVLILLLSVCLIDFGGCRNKDNNPVDPTDSTMAGQSTIAGQVVIPPNRFNVDEIGDFSGVKVQLMNTSLQTESDYSGRWKFQNLDSGIYSIKFTKEGYDTVIIRNVPLNKKDSAYIGRTAVKGDIRIDVLLGEKLNGRILTPSAQIVATVIKEHKDPRDSTKILYREMDYDFSAEMGIEIRGLKIKSWDELIHGNMCMYNICYTITNSPTIDLSAFPSMSRGNGVEVALDSTRRWKFVYNNSKPERFSKTGVYKLPFFNDENISTIAERYQLDLTNKEQLYLHIIPMWLQLGRDNYSPEWAEYWHRGDVVSIPIQWK